jgi:hypothetical protein
MEKIEKWLIRSWERIKHKIDYALTGQDPDEVEWDAFLDRMVAVRTGMAPALEPRDEWILCAVHQPPHSGTYLTTTAKGAVRVNHYYDYHGTWGYNNDAVAWRPMPEAWRQTE